MTTDEFVRSTKDANPPAGIKPVLESLWYDKKGDWHRSHEIAQNIHTADGSWVHAYLHRKEGDLSNARYWYNRAGKPVHSGSVDEEWMELVGAFLS